jgi:hypothetical protein
LLKHIRRCHENDPKFLVYCHVCGSSFKKWETLRKHIQRSSCHNAIEPETVSTCHQPEVEASVTSSLAVVSHVTDMTMMSDYDVAASNSDIDDMEVQIDEMETDRSKEIEENESALFMLRVTNELSLNHANVTRLCSAVEWYVDILTDSITDKVQRSLKEAGVTDKSLLDDISEACQTRNIFDKLSSRYQREQYFENNLHYVKPEPVCMGSEWDFTTTVNGERKLMEFKHYGYYVDIFATITSLLYNPAARREILTSHKSDDGIKRDFCDGDFFNHHPIFTTSSNVLQFVLYYDDIEVANALGSRAGNHKLGCFYFTLANIRPAFRSSLSSIFLLAIAKTKTLKDFTAEGILQRFVQQMNILSQGYVFTLGSGVQVKLFGALVCSVGDIPASCFLGGFKEGVGFSFRNCRMCMATRTDINY